MTDKEFNAMSLNGIYLELERLEAMDELAAELKANVGDLLETLRDLLAANSGYSNGHWNEQNIDELMRDVAESAADLADGCRP